MCDIII